MEVNDYVKAMRELDGKYVGNRPIKLTPSKWQDKTISEAKTVIQQPNAAAKQITEFESQGGTHLTEKYASLLGEKHKARLDKMFAKR